MKTNKEVIYEFIQKYSNSVTGEEIKGVTTQYLSKKMGMQRTNISSILNALVKEKKIEKIQGRPVYYRIPSLQGKEASCFKNLIGHDGSLKNAVQLAKAAILYPQYSLSTLILGPQGSGKSNFAKKMYEFALENRILEEDAPFVKFNCRNYNDDPQQMTERLFGKKKHADKCAVSEAKHGVLFIDHVDLLPVDARIALFNLKDQENSKIIDMILICAGNDNMDTAVKDAISSKFSVVINIPSLNNRKKEERLELVQYFLIKESIRMKRRVQINSELMRCLLLYSCEFNIKQLKRDIKIGCANAYVREFNYNEEILHVYVNDFYGHVRTGFLYYKNHREEIEELLPSNYAYYFHEENMQRIVEEKSNNYASETIYEVIEQKAMELRERGIAEEDINTIISADIENEFHDYTKKLVSQNIDKNKLAKIVNNRIITMVEEFLEQAGHKFDKVYPESIFYGLCLHLSSTLERANNVQQLTNAQIMETVEQYKDEYMFCMSFSQRIEKEFNIHLPIDEVIFITMFICDTRIQNQSMKKPNVLVAMHGVSTATSIVDVVNNLVKEKNIYAFDLALDKDMKEAYEELKAKIMEIDNGKGIIMLYDMGSLRTMTDMIIQETGIKIKMIEMPATLIALDCSRKACGEGSLTSIYDSVMESYQSSFENIQQTYKRQYNRPVIITLCMSGKGGAVQMKRYIEKNIVLNDTDIIPYAVSDREYLLNEINNIKKDSDILCVIGTYDPQLYGVPFISITQLFETDPDKLSSLLSLGESEEYSYIDYEAIYEYLKEQLYKVDIRKLKRHMPKVMTKIKKKVHILSQDQELGLFMHIACAVQRIITEEHLPVNLRRNEILNKNKRLYGDLKDILYMLERSFNIEFSDDELATIICIIKKI